MEGGFLAPLTAPITKLIESLSLGVSGATKPWQIKRVAEAEADAKLIHAEADGAVLSIHDRAKARREALDAARQANLEAVAAYAAEALPESVSSVPVDRAWMSKFLRHAEDAFDQEMRSVWGRILAGEVEEPGSFSRRTLEQVGMLNKSDAEQFANLCRFGTDQPCLLVIDLHNASYRKLDSPEFGDLVHLDNIGLIRFDPRANFTSEEELGSDVASETKSRRILYRERAIDVQYNDFVTERRGSCVVKSVYTGQAVFAATGIELRQIVDTSFDPNVAEYLCNVLGKFSLAKFDESLE